MKKLLTAIVLLSSAWLGGESKAQPTGCALFAANDGSFNCTFGVKVWADHLDLTRPNLGVYWGIRDIVATTDTIDGGYLGTLIRYCNASPITVTLPQASNTAPTAPYGSGNGNLPVIFANGWYIHIKNICAGLVTINTTTSTFDATGTSSITVGQNQSVTLMAYSGNWSVVANALSTGNSGGVVCFTGTTRLTAGPALNANGVVYGSGVNNCPSSTAAFTTGQILVGQSAAPPAPVTMSGDATINAAGALTLNTVSVAKGGTGSTTAQAAMAALKGVYILGASAVASAHTGSTTETTLATISVPANAMGPNGIVRITAQWSHTGTAGTWRPRVKFNGTTITDPVSWGATALSGRTQAQFANRNATNSQVNNSTGQANWSQDGSLTSTVTMTHDTTGALNITITGELASAADTITLESYLVELMVP